MSNVPTTTKEPVDHKLINNIKNILRHNILEIFKDDTNISSSDLYLLNKVRYIHNKYGQKCKVPIWFFLFALNELTERELTYQYVLAIKLSKNDEKTSTADDNQDEDYSLKIESDLDIDILDIIRIKISYQILDIIRREGSIGEKELIDIIDKEYGNKRLENTGSISYSVPLWFYEWIVELLLINEFIVESKNNSKLYITIHGIDELDHRLECEDLTYDGHPSLEREMLIVEEDVLESKILHKPPNLW